MLTCVHLAAVSSINNDSHLDNPTDSLGAKNRRNEKRSINEMQAIGEFKPLPQCFPIYKQGQPVGDHFILHYISLREYIIVVIMLPFESLLHHQTDAKNVRNILL